MYSTGNLSERIAENIIQSIQAGFYQKGQQMPSEVELGQELGVSRATIREAIKLLLGNGYLVVRRGIGTFVSDTPGVQFAKLTLPKEDLFKSATDILRLMKWLHKDILDHVTPVNHEVVELFKTQCQTRTKTDELQWIMTLMSELSVHMDKLFIRSILESVHESAKLLLQERLPDVNNVDEKRLIQFSDAIINDPAQAIIIHHAIVDAWWIKLREDSHGLI